jgi:glycosyltransferase involved in cell wall biosynthesis
MKVLHIINNLAPAGAEILQSLIAPEMKRRGVDAEVATIYKYDNRTVYERLVGAGVAVHSLDFGRRYDPGIFGAIRKLAQKKTYDVIHANLFPTLYYTALARPRCAKMVVTEHNTFNRRMNRSFFKPIERLVYGRYDSIVCVGDTVHKALCAWLPALGSRMTVIYNGIDLDRFKAARPAGRAGLGVPAGAPVCAMVARFYKPKDHKTVIDAATMIPDLHVLFIGEGENMRLMQERASRLGVGERIHFLGYRNDIPSLLKVCDLYVHSSYNEGIPLSVAEAMACGLPVIASNVTGLSEIVQDNTSGFLFRCADPADLARKINAVLHDKGLREKLRSGALARASDFSLDSTVTRLLSLYNS